MIVIYHGGKEHYRYPSPYLQKVCRKIVDKGADLVITQHSHCIGCEEKYSHSTIVYGQGNFLFDHSESEFWATSLLVSVDLKTKQVEYLPICKNREGVKLASIDDATDIISEFQKRTKQIKQSNFVSKEYSIFALKLRVLYLYKWDILASSVGFRAINKLSKGKLLTWYLNRKLKKNRYSFINYIECEAHRELFLEGLRQEIN